MCEATFFDGPLRGQTRVFDRAEPPPLVFLNEPIIDPGASLDAPLGFRKITYVRDVNPFVEGSAWAYMLETVDETQRHSSESKKK